MIEYETSIKAEISYYNRLMPLFKSKIGGLHSSLDSDWSFDECLHIKMKVMIAAGGTGGHINPALALCEVLKNSEADTEIVFFGSSNRMEAKMIPEKGYRFYGTEMSGMNGGILAKAKSAITLLKAEKQCGDILKKEKPDICVGFGNYITVPLIKKAHAFGIQTMISEQNSFVGKANRFLAPKADAIECAYASNIEQLATCKDKIRVLGNPEATLAAETVWDPNELIQIGLNPDLPFVVFMMGSLGSETVSKVIDESLPLFDPSFQVVVAAGKSNDYHFSFPQNDRIRIVDYVNGRNMLKGCALAVVRAGATTMCELTAIGTAAVLIPSPYVPNNHQYVNAMDLVNHHAAVLIEEKDLTKECLSKTVNDLLEDPSQLALMRKNANACGKPNAAYEMIEWMKELIQRA